MKALAVVGRFEDNGGRESSIGRILTQELGWESINGGNIDILQSIDAKLYDVILWMPDIPNTYPDKILPRLKVANRKLVLISSKACRDEGHMFGGYNDADVVGRLLKSKSNLGIAIYDTNGHYFFHLIDPLGNIYADTYDISELATAIRDRVADLLGVLRCSSNINGPRIDFEVDDKFLVIVRRFGVEFAKYVNAINPNRYLGNAATRCAFGFPAERLGDTLDKKGFSIAVSRRDVPKDSITSADFVEVSQASNTVLYNGTTKPSVDAPVQLMLFQYFEQIKYMIHGHVYVEGAPTTSHKFPCGDMREFYDTSKIVDKHSDGFAINLFGHGCLIACRDLAYFDTVKLKARPFPEDQTDHWGNKVVVTMKKPTEFVGDIKIHRESGKIHFSDKLGSNVTIPVAEWYEAWVELRTVPGYWNFYDRDTGYMLEVDTLTNNECEIGVCISIVKVEPSTEYLAVDKFTDNLYA